MYVDRSVRIPISVYDRHRLEIGHAKGGQEKHSHAAAHHPVVKPPGVQRDE